MHGIPFRPEMIQAIVNGSKTQTRGVIKHPEKYDNIRGCDFCAPYQVGDILYIKEAYIHTGHGLDCLYKSDKQSKLFPIDKWRSPLFMPAWAARYFIKITDVKVERLQEITYEEAIKEGCPESADSTRYYFHVLWDTINKPPHDWQSNPWCFVYTFKKVERKEIENQG